MRLAQGTVFSIGGANAILLFWLEVIGPAKVHLAAATGACAQKFILQKIVSRGKRCERRRNGFCHKYNLS